MKGTEIFVCGPFPLLHSFYITITLEVTTVYHVLDTSFGHLNQVLDQLITSLFLGGGRNSSPPPPPPLCMKHLEHPYYRGSLTGDVSQL